MYFLDALFCCRSSKGIAGGCGDPAGQRADLVRKAKMIGLRELTRNLARLQGWTSTATKSYLTTSEMQHA